MNTLLKGVLFLVLLWVLSTGIASLFFVGGGIEFSGEKIAVIPIEGMLTLKGGGSLFSSTSSADMIVGQIQSASEDPSVKGIVLDINSPGGTVMGSKVIVDAVQDVEKPVIAVVSEYGTSGAYWVASQADYIIADELSIVGSIGVLGSYLEFGGLLEDYNVTYQRLVVGEYKDISSPYREMTEEEEELLQERLQGIYERFVADVAVGRHMDVAEVEALADGLFYLGKDAVKNGLIDTLGDKEFAISVAEELSGVTHGKVSEYENEDFFSGIVQEYLSYMSFYIGKGIGSVFFSVEGSELEIHL